MIDCFIDKYPNYYWKNSTLPLLIWYIECVNNSIGSLKEDF